MRHLTLTMRGRAAAAVVLVVLLVAATACGATGTPAPVASSDAGSGASPTATSAATSSAPTSTATVASLTPSPADSLPAGWILTSVTADGYSIATPKDWTPVALSGQNLDAMIADFQKTNPEMASLLQNAKDSGQVFSFMAITTDPGLIGDTGFAPNVNVIVGDNQGYGSDFIALANVAQLRKLTSIEGDVENIAYPLPADPTAHRLRSHLKFSAALTTVATLYVITKGSKVYSITVSAVDSQLAGLEDSFTALARSFTILP